MNYQKFILVGNATKDAKAQTSKKGDVTYTTFTLGVGDRKGETIFFPIVAFGKLGEISTQYVTKGTQTLVEGRIQLSDKGRMSVIADRAQFGMRQSPIQPVDKAE